MKKYLIKYENLDGDVQTKEVYGYSEQDATRKLFFVKEIYWIKTLTPNNQLKTGKV